MEERHELLELRICIATRYVCMYVFEVSCLADDNSKPNMPRRPEVRPIADAPINTKVYCTIASSLKRPVALIKETSPATVT